MAKYIGLGTDTPIEDSEKRMAEALKRLPDDWVVLHHVSWQSKRNGKQGDGEADFILLHPKRGILVLEVKGGGIEIETGRWFTINRHGDRHSIKNPYEQAVASKHALIAWLGAHGLEKKVQIGHAIAFPHMANLPHVGIAGAPEISFTKLQLPNIETLINKCCNYWKLEATLSAVEFKKIVTLLAPTVSLSSNLSAKSSDAEKEIFLLTSEQIEAFSGLRAHRGGLILGPAGTGKTMLAVARAQQLATDGFRTLLVCYNELLASHLSARSANSTHLTAGTFHALCLREAQKAKLDIPSIKSHDWWESEAPNLLIDACATNETMFDAIVVDEGQDFSSRWLNSLHCLISGQADAPFFIFADPLQDIWKRDWDQGADHPFVWNLARNMRNTLPIATRVAAAVNIDCQSKGINGPTPIWRISKAPAGEKEIISAVEHLLDEGFGPSNLAVLCESASLVERLRERSVGPYSFGKWGSRGIATETVSRFKGLEEQAIVLALSPITTSEGQIGAYIGMSRARSVLIVIGSEADRQKINWLKQMS